jgi:hypothetical protein
MANIVEQILTETKSLMATELGGDYQELAFIYDVEKNNLRGARMAYGVRPVDASSAATLTRSYTLDHVFEIILTDTFARGDSDAQRETSLNTMYDKADEIFKSLVNHKINLPSTVLNVEEPSIAEPEFLDDNKLIVLRMQYVVKWRSDLNL